MPRVRIKRALRPRKRDWAESVEVPRWIAAAAVVAIGLLVLLAGLSNGSERVAVPGSGTILYLAAVFGVAALIVYTGRPRR